MRDVIIASSVRTPVGRAFKGTLRATRPDELAAIAIKGALNGVPQLDAKEIEDVIIGCAMPEAEQGMNVARIASLRAGLPVEISALTINRFCSSGLQAIAMAAERIMSGGAEVIVAGGTESMSMIPMGGHKISPNPWLVDHYPDAYLSMGLTAERLAHRFGITREAADEFSLRSHQKALAAIQAGRFEDEVVPVPVSFSTPNGSKPKRQEIVFKVDEGPRADTSLEALLGLKPAFHVKGTVTAGNSSQMSDGAAAAIVMSAERAQALGIKPLARYVSFATAGYKPEEMGLGPVFAIPKALKMAGLKLSDIEVIELNEAFAAQSLAVIKEGGLDPEKVNPNGGAIALGHPLGCTGAKLTASVIREMKRRKARYGMVTMCVGGGMGAAGIFENAYKKRRYNLHKEVPMTSVRLLTAAVLICTASAFAQEQPSSATRTNRTAEPESSARVTTSAPWKIIVSQPKDSRESSLQWMQFDPMAVRADARPGDDTLCYKIRSYVVARDSKDSDSVHPVGYSTCQPASRYRLKKTQIQTGSSAK